MKKFVFISILLLNFNSYTAVRVPVALENLGNTCYMNSSLQALYSATLLTDFILNYGLTYYKPATIGYEYAKLVNEITQGKLIHTYDNPKEKYYEPSEDFCIPMFEKFFKGDPYYAQQDAADFIRQLFNGLSDDDINTEYKSNKKFPTTNEPLSPINVMFKFLVNSAIFEFQKDIQISSKDESNISLELPIAQQIEGDLTAEEVQKLYGVHQDYLYKDLETCLEAYFSKEDMTGSNKYELGGELIDAQKQLSILTLPYYLIVGLKRFNMGSDYKRFKLDHGVSFKNYNNLNLSPYLSKAAAGIRDIEYELIAIVQQSGSLEVGHYTAYAKHSGQWYYCNDKQIEKVPESKIEAIADIGLDRNFTPYILFFKQKRPLTLDNIIDQIPDVKEKLLLQASPSVKLVNFSQFINQLFDFESTLKLLTALK